MAHGSLPPAGHPFRGTPITPFRGTPITPFRGTPITSGRPGGAAFPIIAPGSGDPGRLPSGDVLFGVVEGLAVTADTLLILPYFVSRAALSGEGIDAPAAGSLAVRPPE